MKQIVIFILVLSALGSKVAFGQSNEAQQLLLNVEKLTSFKQILTDMKKGYEIISSGYTAVKDISQGNFSLHKTFLDALMQVSPTVKNYKKVGDIITLQIKLVKRYKITNEQLVKSNLLNSDELKYVAGVYKKLFDASLNNLDDLTMVITAEKLRMNDEERLKAIDRIYDDMLDKTAFLRDFNNAASVLVFQRMKVRGDAGALGKLHGLK